MSTHFRAGLADLAVMAPAVVALVNCAGPPTEEQEYERHEAYNQMVIRYENEVRQCRRTGGSMVSSGSWSRRIDNRLSVEQIRSARCVSRH
jgi:hypothetical protein